MIDPVTAIAADRLSLDFEANRLLDDISLAIPAGAVVGLVGRNGAGKSTLLRCLLGFTVPDSGSSRLLGCPSLALSDAVRERLGYVAQTPDLFEWMDAWEHVETVGRAYARWTSERAMRLAVQLGVPLGRKVKAFSLGDQQKLAVALALAHDPDLVLMDEPVASLDPLTRRAFMRAIFEYRDGDRPARTILISSHLLGDLERVVSHLAFMRSGRLQLFGEWDELAENLRVVDAERARDPLHIAADGRAVVDGRAMSGSRRQEPGIALDELFAVLNS